MIKWRKDIKIIWSHSHKRRYEEKWMDHKKKDGWLKEIKGLLIEYIKH